MVALSKEFHRLKPFKVLVLGDLLLDMYTLGKVQRISPEAPVPVLHVEREEYLPGGSGNVALSLKALGAEVFCAGRIGEDLYGAKLQELLNLDQMDQTHIFQEKGYPTPVKNRFIADNQQLIRVDHELITPISLELETKIIASLSNLIPQMQIIALSDYGKGFLTPRLLSAVIKMANEAGVPTIVDPKGTDFSKYAGATMIKPNANEAYLAAKKAFSTPIAEVAEEIFTHASIKYLLITRSELGMSLFAKGKKAKNFPVISKEVLDVTGAGDTVLATLCLAIANKLEIESSVQLANASAGIAIERLGCARVTLAELAERLLRFENVTKVFDQEHSRALSESLKGKQQTLLVIQKNQPLLLKEIKQFACTQENQLIIYAQGYDPDDLTIHVLSTLVEVDCIILQSESLKSLIEEIRPEKVYTWQSGKATQLNHGTDVLHALLKITAPPKQNSLS